MILLVQRFVNVLGIWENLRLARFFFQNGGKILFATDDFFAVAENLIKVRRILF